MTPRLPGGCGPGPSGSVIRPAGTCRRGTPAGRRLPGSTRSAAPAPPASPTSAWTRTVDHWPPRSAGPDLHRKEGTVPAATTATAGTARPDVLDLSPELAARIPPIQVAMWRDAARRVGNCAHPVRLRGQVHQVDRATGELREVYATDREPDGLLRKPCGNRRASVCPACAEVYRQDAYQLLRAGLAGGKGVPESVAEHPALFVTFTAPSFGPVHTYRTNRAGRLLPCHPRRRPEVCPHGVRLDCRRVHPAGDPRVGEPLCARCYQYAAHVLFNAIAPELWRRTTIYLPRALAHAAGL